MMVVTAEGPNIKINPGFPKYPKSVVRIGIAFMFMLRGPGTFTFLLRRKK